MLIEEMLFNRCQRYITIARMVYEATGKKLLFIRGTNNLPIEEIINTRPRSRPMNTNIVIHNTANEFFDSKFGVKLRTDSVFATTSKGDAAKYGTPYYMVPIGGAFSFYHSDSVHDMYRTFNSQSIYEMITTDSDLSEEQKREFSEIFEDDTRTFGDYLCDNHPDLAAKYVERKLDDSNYVKNKVGAFTSGNEIMVVCKQYILLPMDERYTSFFDEVVFGL